MERVVKTKFYCYVQNNPYGTFYVNEEVGIGHFVVVEGLNEEHIQQRLNSIVRIHSDCSERWDDWIDKDSLSDVPNVFGEDIDEYINRCFVAEEIAFIHYIDGTFEKRKYPIGLNVGKLIKDNEKYIGKLGLFFDSEDQECWRIGRLVKVDSDGFHTKDDDPFTYFKPLTDEQIKVLDFNV